MANQYEADKIIQLLQFCCWKANTTMNHSGLVSLTNTLGELPGTDEQYPNEKYFVDLLSDARGALNKGNLIKRRKQYIDLLLNYGGYSDWNLWKNSIYNSDEYLKAKNLGTTSLEQLKIAVWIPESLGRHLRSILNQINKSSIYSLDMAFYPDELSTDEIIENFNHLNRYDLIIWPIPIAWINHGQPMKNSNWMDSLKLKLFIPIWIDPAQLWGTENLFISFLNSNETISGIPGLLCSILLINELFENDFHLKNPENDHPDTKLASNVQNFYDSSSGFVNQGNIQHQNTTIQTITNYHSK